MLALMLEIAVESDKVDDALEKFEHEILSKLRTHPLYRGVQLLREPSSDRFICITLWNQQCPYREKYTAERLDTIRDLLSADPTWQELEVVGEPELVAPPAAPAG